MTTSLERNLRELERVLGPGTDARVSRVDVDRRGHIVSTVDDETEPEPCSRWFSFDGRLRELEPHSDPLLPICDRRAFDGERLRVVSWRPGRRMTLRDGTGAFVKAYRAGRVTGSADRIRLAGASLARTGLSVPRVLGIDEPSASLRMEALAGRSCRVRASDTEEFFRFGAALARWQESVPIDGLASHSALDELAVLDDWARRVRAVADALPPRWVEARELVGQRLPIEGPPRVCHRDLHDGQIVLQASGIGLLDFDLLCSADPALDVANLSVHFRLRALQELDGATHAGADACARALMEGVDASFDDPYLVSLRFYQATSFLRLALVYSLRPRWRGLPAPLVELARRSIHELPTR